MNVWGRIAGVMAVLWSVSASAQTPAEKFTDSDWPKQTQIDAEPFFTVFDQAFPLARADDPGSPDPTLVPCGLSEAQQWQAVGLTPEGIDLVNPAAHMPESSAGLTSKALSIEVLSNAAGCATLQTAEFLNNIPDSEKLFFSARHLRQPVYIRVHFETGTLKNLQPTRSDNVATIRHVETGIKDYPWAVRSWRKNKITGPFTAEMTIKGLHFDGINGAAAYESVALERIYDKDGKLTPAPPLRLQWQEEGVRYLRVWAGVLLFSYRDSKRHGLNFIGLDLNDGSFQYGCYGNDQAFDYYRVINDYDCVPAQASEFGQQGVFRSSMLTKVAAKEEADAVVAVEDGNPGVTGMAGECTKAYMAARVCQQMPSDPFGIARGVCASSVKKKFGGSGCKLPF